MFLRRRRMLGIAVTAWLVVTGALTSSAAQTAREVWVRRVPNSLEAHAMALDAAGSVYVTGEEDTPGNYHAYTVKYDAHGRRLWLHGGRQPSIGSLPAAIAVHDGGDAYVVGTQFGVSGADYLTMRHDGTTGELLEARVLGEGVFNDAFAVAVDRWSNVHVTGRLWDSGNTKGLVTVKYDPTLTEVLWRDRYDGHGAWEDGEDGVDAGYAIAVDDDGYAYVTGEAEVKRADGTIDSDIVTIKYDRDTGTRLWTQPYDRPGMSDDPAALAIDPGGWVYVTGTSGGSIVTIKHSLLDGAIDWSTRWDGAGDGRARGIAVDPEGRVYVTGESAGADGTDIVTIKYAGTTPDVLWAAHYTGGGEDLSKGIAVDAKGRVYVAGASETSPTAPGHDYVTIAYAGTTDDTLWTRRFDGDHADDIPVGIAVDDAGLVHIAGTSWSSDYNDRDYVIVKYAQEANRPPVADAGPERQVEECQGPLGAEMLFDASGTMDPHGDPIELEWSAPGIEFLYVGLDIYQIATRAQLPVGDTPVTLTVTDESGLSDAVTVLAVVQDTTPPEIELTGDATVVLELGTPYTEPGATATDACGGDLSHRIRTEGLVDEQAEGTYEVTYRVVDVAENDTEATRTVRVVTTPNSYVLAATRSLAVGGGAQVHDGFIGVTRLHRRPVLASGADLELGVGVHTWEGVRLTAPRVQVGAVTVVDGPLYHNAITGMGTGAIVPDPVTVGLDHWPLFGSYGLPAFLRDAPGTVDVRVAGKQVLQIGALAFRDVTVEPRGTLVLRDPGVYRMRSLAVGRNARIQAASACTLLVAQHLQLGPYAHLGPVDGSGVSAADIGIYVDGEDRVVASFEAAAKVSANVYAPRGAVSLGAAVEFTGSVLGQDVFVADAAEVALASGWATPGVSYEPQPAPVRKPAAQWADPPGKGAPSQETSLDPNQPNPFNPSTTIQYTLAEPGPARLRVYNTLGQLVRVLADAPQQAGTHRLTWDGTDARGRPVAAGTYVYRLEAGAHVLVGRMTLVK